MFNGHPREECRRQGRPARGSLEVQRHPVRGVLGIRSENERQVESREAKKQTMVEVVLRDYRQSWQFIVNPCAEAR